MAEGSTTDEGRLQQAHERQRRHQMLQEAALTKVMQTGEGRRVMYHLIYDLGGALSLSWRGPGTAGEQMLVNEGRKAFAFDLNNELMRVCPELVEAMVLERQKALALERVISTEAVRAGADASTS